MWNFSAPRRAATLALAVFATVVAVAGCRPSEPLPVIRVLAIDGGGARGVIPAVFLDEIERRVGALQGRERAPIHELFDVVAGTSTGSLITAMLTVPAAGSEKIATAAEIHDYYMEEAGPLFFARDAEWEEKAKTGTIPAYPAESHIAGIQGAIERSAMLSAAATDVAMTIYDLAPEPPRTYTLTRRKARYGEDFTGVSDLELSRLQERRGASVEELGTRFTYSLGQRYGEDLSSLSERELLSSPPGDHDFPMWQAVRGASTFPGIWPGWTMKSVSGVEYHPLDGGIYAINPVLEGLAHAIRVLTDRRLAGEYRFLVVSLGTGFYNAGLDPAETEMWGAAQWFVGSRPPAPIVGVLFEGQADLADTLMQKISGLENRVRHYYRFQPRMAEDFQLDQFDEKTMKTLRGYATAMVERRTAEFDAIAELLADPNRLAPEPCWKSECEGE